MEMKMEINNQTKLYWKSNFGLFQATLWDNKITNIALLKEGSSMSSSGFRMCDDNVEFLREVYSAIKDILGYIDNVERDRVIKNI